MIDHQQAGRQSEASSSAAERPSDDKDLIHGTLLTYDSRGLLIRGPSGSGKSTLALQLLYDAPTRGLEAQLVSDDQVVVWRKADALWGRAPTTIAGLIEVRGLGIVPCDTKERARIDWVIDLVDGPLTRLPEPKEQHTQLLNASIKRLKLPQSGYIILPQILAALVIAPIKGAPID